MLEKNIMIVYRSLSLLYDALSLAFFSLIANGQDAAYVTIADLHLGMHQKLVITRSHAGCRTANGLALTAS